MINLFLCKIVLNSEKSRLFDLAPFVKRKQQMALPKPSEQFIAQIKLANKGLYKMGQSIDKPRSHVDGHVWACLGSTHISNRQISN